MKFRKRPVVIDAWQLPGGPGYDLEAVLEIAKLCDGAPVPDGMLLKTLEGTMLARLGDWIIRGVAGEFYPCKADIFEATYEPVP